MSCTTPSPEVSSTSSRGKSVSTSTLGRRQGSRRCTTLPQSATPSPPSKVRRSVSSRSHCRHEGPGVLTRARHRGSHGAACAAGAATGDASATSRCARDGFAEKSTKLRPSSGLPARHEGDASAAEVVATASWTAAEASLRGEFAASSARLLATGTAADARDIKRCPTSGVHSADEAKSNECRDLLGEAGSVPALASERSILGGGARRRSSAKAPREPPKKAWRSTSASPSGPSPGRSSGREASSAATSSRARG
mmetsp:Transcript_109726/g.321182  ORF Transcript_109726/g.321182 Transcript_109726/m.321182 type:complete len:254 (+) Transcript_109726:407-1168(+)